MKMVNIGCGSVFHPDWINVDVSPVDPRVRQLDVRRALPFSNAEVDVVYHSHLLEHLSRSEASRFLSDCLRILKPGGIMRVAVPDLEGIASAYLRELLVVMKGGNDTLYEWLRLELTDQLTREKSGGEMAEFLAKLAPSQVPIIRSRVGVEADSILAMRSASRRRVSLAGIWLRARSAIGRQLLFVLGGQRMRSAFDAGWFRQSGEVHRIMYDRLSLGRLLVEVGFSNPRITSAIESRIPNFDGYGLDAVSGSARKPDSLYMEVMRPLKTR